MRVCISSKGNTFDAQVDPRFGRCLYFFIVDTDTLEYKAIKNPNVEAAVGAGIQSAQEMVNQSVKIVITGYIGPNAFETLKAAGIQVVTNMSGRVEEVLRRYKMEKLKPTKVPTKGAQFVVHEGAMQRR
jgi:predicted Fe-Mo cluster-binding NifX family protein